MKTKKIIYHSLAALTLTFGTLSCTGDLDQMPHVETTSATVYTTAEGIEAVMGKIYNSMTTNGQGKGGDNADLSSNMGYDYIRCWFNLQECGTDEVASTWLSGDKSSDITFLTWDANDPWVADMYYRIYYNITLCNEFLRNCTEDKDALSPEIPHYRAEARFMRALFYTHALDLFRNIPFVTENDPVGSFIPPRNEPKQTFEFIESELKDIVNDLYPAASCPYARASQGAAYTLLAQLYLNAEVYIGEPKYAECIEACENAIAQGYSLESDYQKLFNADNHLRSNEIIFALAVDPVYTVSWGASTYVVCGEIPNAGSTMQPEDYGVTSGWGMFRARGELPKMFEGAEQEDGRYLFHTDGQTQYIEDITAEDQTQGYCVKKWSNLTDAGEVASNTAEGGVATDWPLMRLADVYLMYAEAVVRSNDQANGYTAKDYVNALRQRAYGNTQGDITFDQMWEADFFLKERARELYWEGYRRTDLIRFGKFTTADYLWQWKGGVKDGQKVDAKYNIYPIPATELTANPNLSNPLY